MARGALADAEAMEQRKHAEHDRQCLKDAIAADGGDEYDIDDEPAA